MLVMKLNILKIHSLISLFFLTSILFSDEYILVPKNILDVQTGKLYEANIHIKDGLITSISNKKLCKENKQIINCGCNRLTWYIVWIVRQ